MDRRLFEAAYNGDIDALRSLIKENVLVLDAACLLEGDSPLHVAAVAGRAEFVREVLNLRKELAEELNQDGLSPLHVAAAKRDVLVARELLRAGHHLCLVRGRERRLPLHYSAIKGRVVVLRELLLACPESILEVTARGESVLHLAVSNNRFEAFEVLLEQLKILGKVHMLNWKDAQGNTILHLAVARKQYEVVEFLLRGDTVHTGPIEVNAVNEMGLTPLDILSVFNNEPGDAQISEILTRAGAARARGLPPMLLVSSQDQALDTEQPGGENLPCRTRTSCRLAFLSSIGNEKNKWVEYFKYKKDRDSADDVRSALLVIAALIATATYQSVLQPPGGLWQDDSGPSGNSTNASTGGTTLHKAGQAILGTKNQVSYILFLTFNSVGFFASIQMIYILTAGFPLKLELRLALFALMATYDTSMGALTPSTFLNYFFVGLSIFLPFLLSLLSMCIRT